VKLVLVSGMRTSTLLKRLPYLPKADAYASEAGGRIFYPTPIQANDENNSLSGIIRPVDFNGSTEEDLRHFGLEEDMHWRSLMSRGNSAGQDGYNGDIADIFLGMTTDGVIVPLQERKGALWDFANSLVAKGFVIDSNGYACCFRVNRKQQKGVNDEEFDKLSTYEVEELELGSSVNLGCIDFYPIESGKKNCCAYLAERFSRASVSTSQIINIDTLLSGEELLSHKAMCLCDDDNDFEMAMACKRAFLPSVTSSSMADAARDNPDQITVTERKESNIISTLATESALIQVMSELKKVWELKP
jgi:hypothetical protein